MSKIVDNRASPSNPLKAGTTAATGALADPSDVVRDGIRAAILEGAYGPRERLVEADLCARFATSRFVVRAALQELAALGLIEFQRNRGARVRDVSLHEAIEITEVRMLLEGHVAARAAGRATRAEAAELRRLVQAMRTSVSAGDLMGYSDLNVALHTRLREIADHTMSTRLLEQLRDLTVRHQFTLSLLPGRSQVSLPQHEAIVAAVDAGDEAEATVAMHAHLQSVIEALETLAARS